MNKQSAGPKTRGRPSPLAGKPKMTASTLRLRPELRQGLVLLHRVLKQPVNKLVNQAVEDFIERRTSEVASDLELVLEQIKAYKARDPHFDEAIEQFVQAEAELGAADPAEGKVVDADLSTPGPSQTLVRDLLGMKTGG